jgi:hypothetical protein
MSRRVRPLAERFWERVEKTDKCWLWAGVLYPNGYGQIGRGMRGGGHALAHRVSWELAYGPTSLKVLHHCDVKYCVRPSHLFIGTQKDNIDDCIAKGRKTNPPPFPRGQRGRNAALTDAQVREIRDRHATTGVSQATMAAEYGVSQGAISLIVRHLTYQNLKADAP